MQSVSPNQVPAGVLCACGCGAVVPHRSKDGKKPLYKKRPGPHYIHGHNARGKVHPRKPPAPLPPQAEMPLCACGCGERLPSLHRKPSQKPPRYIQNHFVKAGLSHQGHRTAPRVELGTLCACGCGTPIPTHRPNGSVRYLRDSGRAYFGQHKPPQKGKPGLRGTDNPRWKGGRFITLDGYILVPKPPDYSGTARGRIFEHRLVMEGVLGRHLLRSEFVHHINGIRDDNRPENLELWQKPQPNGVRSADAPHCPTCTCAH